MKMTKEKWLQFGISALIYGVLFTVITFIFNYFSDTTYAWYYYLFQGLFFGLFMSVASMLWDKKN